MRWLRGSARWVFVIAADLSLLLFACSAVFWVRSYFVHDSAELREIWWIPGAPGEVQYHYRQNVVDCCWGELRVNRQHSYSAGMAASEVKKVIAGTHLYSRHDPPSVQSPRGTGFTYLVDLWGYRLGYLKKPQTKMMPWAMDFVGGAAPMWGVSSFFALLPAIRGVMWVRRKPKCDGKVCQRCGYDLRESKVRCPECGTVIGSAA